MSDYSKSYDGAAKDAAQSTITGADFDTEFSSIETAVATKTNKIASPTTNGVVIQTGTGDIADSGKTLPTGTVVGTTDTQTLTNKTLTSPDINGGTWNGTIDGNVVVGGVTLSTTELSYLDGVTSNVQSQINSLGGQKNVTAADGGPYINATLFDANTVIGAAWESVGPTGGGATNTWTALDAVPTDINWIKVRLYAYISASYNGEVYQLLYGRKSGSSVSASTATTLVSNRTKSYSTAVSSDLISSAIVEVTIPVSSRKFDLYLSKSGIGVESLYLILTGYGYN